MQKVFFDSSFLMSVSEKPTTWFEDIVDGAGRFQPVLLECVRDELGRIASGDGRKSRLARVALDLSAGFETLPCGKAQVDDEMQSAASSAKAYVATTDGELLRTLKASHVKSISLRSGRVVFS